MSARKPGHREIAIQRAYEDPTAHDGYRVLVDIEDYAGRDIVAAAD